MSRFDEIIQHMKSAGEAHEFSPDFTQRTLDRIAQIRPFATADKIARDVPRTLPIRISWRVAVSALAAMILIAIMIHCFSANGSDHDNDSTHILSDRAQPAQHQSTASDNIAISPEPGIQDHADNKRPLALTDLNTQDEELAQNDPMDSHGFFAADPSFIQRDMREKPPRRKKRVPQISEKQSEGQ